MRWMRAVYRSVQLQQPRPPAFHNIVDGFSLKKGRLLTCVLATRAGKRWTLFKRPQSAHSPSHFEKKKNSFPFCRLGAKHIGGCALMNAKLLSLLLVW